MPRMKSPNEIARLQQKKNEEDEQNRLLEAEKNIPFKKRRVRFGQDGFNEDMAPNMGVLQLILPKVATPPPPSPPREQTPVLEVSKNLGVPEASSPEQAEEDDETPKEGEFCVEISKQDQQKAQDLWCEYQWNKLHPDKPLRLLKYIALERFDPGEEDHSAVENTSEVETASTSEAPKRPVRRVHFS